MADEMRIRRSYIYIAAGFLLLGFIALYSFPNYFHLSTYGGWHMYPREWVRTTKGYGSSGSFTYLTYNLLNDVYKRQYRHEYQACENVRDFFNETVRQSHLLVEVETMNPDVTCFQEIDEKWYDKFWYPQLSARGYEGMLGVDQSDRDKVGQAIFWKKSKFDTDFNEKHFYHDLVIRYVENTLVGEEQKEFLTWFKKSSLLLLAEFVDKNSRTGSKFIVGCTHISAAQEESPAMQTLQVALALQRLNAFSQTRKTRALILSGDFNTPPSYPTYEFIKQGRITGDMKKSYESKTPLQKLKPEMKKFALSVLNLMPVAFEHELYLQSAYHSVMGSEPHTTCLGDGALDYIWYNPDHLIATGVLKEPENSRLLQERTTEACSLFASDHLPVQAEFHFASSKS